MHFVPVDPLDLYVAQPVPWPLYDREGQQVLDEGQAIDSEQQMRTLLAHGLYRASETPPPAPVRAEPAPAPKQKPEQQSEYRSLDETRLAVGDALQLQPQSDGPQTRLQVTLVGYLKGKGIIVTAPIRDGKLLLVREGQTFVARMFSGKNAYAFPTSTLKVTNVPYPHLHLAYPARVESVMVRRDARVSLRLICAVQSRHIPSAAALLTDLSNGGCSLQAEHQLAPKGEDIVIKFKAVIGGVEQVLSLRGIVRAASVAEQPGGRTSIQHGVQFAELAPTEQVALTAFVYQKLIEDELKL